MNLRYVRSNLEVAWRESTLITGTQVVTTEERAVLQDIQAAIRQAIELCEDIDPTRGGKGN